MVLREEIEDPDLTEVELKEKPLKEEKDLIT